MDIKYVIIQAGGKGTRLHHLTANKPKGIVPVNNLPMIFHLMNKFKEKKYIIIADYKHEVLEKYLEAFSPADYFVVNATETVTCAGIRKALNVIPRDAPFLLIWSDLVIDEDFDFHFSDKNTIGLSTSFSCRWSYENGVFLETPSTSSGVAGFFAFKNKSYLDNVPESGEFVRWLQQTHINFDVFKLDHVNEVGTLIAYDQQKRDNVCRPFNSVETKGDRIIKKPITPQGETIAKFESNWYRHLSALGYKRIPRIYSYSPLEMDKINGDNVFKVGLDFEGKKRVVKNIVEALKEMHSLGATDTDYFALQNNYITKTLKRIDKVRDLIPFADEKTITINGIRCKNIFYYRKEFRELVEKHLYNTRFVFIHGDCTFSNILIDKQLDVSFIDPRGYFGDVLLYGDEYYDWAKLYYSISGNYDQFNNKNFTLDILDNQVKLQIDSSGYEGLTDYFVSLIPNCDLNKIKIIHAIIWLSLSTYAWEDYDSICGAFYNGLLYLNSFMEDL